MNNYIIIFCFLIIARFSFAQFQYNACSGLVASSQYQMIGLKGNLEFAYPLSLQSRILARISLSLLEEEGLLSERSNTNGYYGINDYRRMNFIALFTDKGYVDQGLIIFKTKPDKIQVQMYELAFNKDLLVKQSNSIICGVGLNLANLDITKIRYALIPDEIIDPLLGSTNQPILIPIFQYQRFFDLGGTLELRYARKLNKTISILATSDLSYFPKSENLIYSFNLGVSFNASLSK